MIIKTKENILHKMISILIFIVLGLISIEYNRDPEFIVLIPIIIIVILIAPKERIIIEESGFSIHSKSFIPFISSKQKFYKNEISKLEFFPGRTNWLMVLTPRLFSGYRPAEIRITFTNGKHYESKTDFEEKDWDIVRNKMKIKKHSP